MKLKYIFNLFFISVLFLSNFGHAVKHKKNISPSVKEIENFSRSQLEQFAKKNNSHAQYILSFKYCFKSKKAIQLLTNAAKNNHKKAQFELFLQLCSTDTKKAAQWLKKSAENNYLEAILMLASYYLENDYYAFLKTINFDYFIQKNREKYCSPDLNPVIHLNIQTCNQNLTRPRGWKTRQTTIPRCCTRTSTS